MMDPVDLTLLMARAALTPSNADDERTRRALGLGSNGLAASPHGALGGARVWAALRASGRAGAAIGALLVGLGFAAGLWVGHRESPVVASVPPAPSATASVALALPTRAESSAPEVQRPASALLDARSEGASEALPPAPPAAGGARRHPAIGRAKPPARAARPSSADGAGGLDPSDELALLRRIEKSLRNEQPALALALLGELSERFPETRLDEERAAASVLVHCALNDPGSRRRAEEFLDQHASSVYADRVRSSCR